MCQRITNNKEKLEGEFSGGPMVKDSPSNTGDTGSIPGWVTEIPHALGHGLKIFKKINEDFLIL